MKSSFLRRVSEIRAQLLDFGHVLAFGVVSRNRRPFSCRSEWQPHHGAAIIFDSSILDTRFSTLDQSVSVIIASTIIRRYSGTSRCRFARFSRLGLNEATSAQRRNSADVIDGRRTALHLKIVHFEGDHEIQCARYNARRPTP